MPHPERFSEIDLGSDDGVFIWKSIFNNLAVSK
jgi:phosphoribosylformylglycinamidine (FGAM) synthase-like amidotransferase family enzyme